MFISPIIDDAGFWGGGKERAAGKQARCNATRTVMQAPHPPNEDPTCVEEAVSLSGAGQQYSPDLLSNLSCHTLGPASIVIGETRTQIRFLFPGRANNVIAWRCRPRKWAQRGNLKENALAGVPLLRAYPEQDYGEKHCVSERDRHRWGRAGRANATQRSNSVAFIIFYS